MFNALYSIPSSTDLLIGIGEWSSPIFDEFLPFIFFLMGLTIGVLIVVGMMTKVGEVLENLINKRD